MSDAKRITGNSLYCWFKAVLNVVDDASFFPRLIDHGEKTWKLSQLGLKPHVFPTLLGLQTALMPLTLTVISIWRGKYKFVAFLLFSYHIGLDFQANTVSSVLRTSSMRSIPLERTSSLPTTSCGPSSCLHPVVAWTRRPHILLKGEMLETERIRSTDWSGGWTDVLVSVEVLVIQNLFGVVNDAYSFPVLSTMLKAKVYI